MPSRDTVLDMIVKVPAGARVFGILDVYSRFSGDATVAELIERHLASHESRSLLLEFARVMSRRGQIIKVHELTCAEQRLLVETPLSELGDQLASEGVLLDVSILSGAHMTLVPRIVELLRAQDAGDVVVTVGGTIPAQDIPELKELGVAEVFTPGASTQEIIDFIQSSVTP